MLSEDTKKIFVAVVQINIFKMAIQITYNAGVYEINGMLISKTTVLKCRDFELLEVVLSLNKVLEIDIEAVKV
jgi:hypothetical protein